MSEKSKLVEEILPSIQSIIDEYAKQGRTLSNEEAELIREQIRKDIGEGRVDAMENLLGDDDVESIAGGSIVPIPSKFDYERFNPKTPDYSKNAVKR